MHKRAKFPRDKIYNFSKYKAVPEGGRTNDTAHWNSISTSVSNDW